MNKTILSLTLMSLVTFGCSKNSSSTPSVAKANEAISVTGLWRVDQEMDEDLVSDENDPVDIYTEYLEITNENVIYYLTDGISNCYEANAFPLTHTSGNSYQIDYSEDEFFGAFAEDGVQTIIMEANESILTTRIVSADYTDAEPETYPRVNNISAQDFNICTLT